MVRREVRGQATYLSVLGLAAVMAGILLALRALFRVLSLPASMRQAEGGTVLLGGVATALFVVLAGLYVMQYGRLIRRLERAQRAAAEGSQTVEALAIDQPIPDVARLDLPCSIALRPRWPRVAANWLLLVLSFMLLAATYELGRGDSVRDAVVFPAAGLLVLGPLLFVLVLNGARQQLTVTEDGLTIMDPSRGRPRTLRWRDATLFAIYPRGRIDAPAVCYELSGPGGGVRWIRLRRPMPLVPLAFSAATKPVISFDEYDRLMEGLLSVIAAKSGLQLYDLRPQRVRSYQGRAGRPSGRKMQHWQSGKAQERQQRKA